MTEPHEIESAVFTLLHDNQRIPLKEISLNKSLNFDLGMDGDDAVEFFEAFAERFQVDLAPLADEWNLYFVPEGWGFDSGAILTLFTAPPLPSRHKRLPLPVSHLVEAARLGHWPAAKEIE